MPPKPSKNRNKTPRGEVMHASASSLEIHQGPLPPPQTLHQYDLIIPGAGERILRMAEDQQAHRHKMEGEAIRAEARNSTLGITTGFIIGMATIIGGSICAYVGRELSGLGLGGAGLGSLVGVFVYGTKSRRKEREQRFGQKTR